jgi:Mg2+ and Co2+ transporter CorA
MTNDDVTRKLGHVEKELAAHGSALVSTAQQMSHLAHRSDERLEYIRERFDDLQEAGRAISAMLDRRHEEMLSARRKIISFASTVLITCFSALWMAILAPMQEEMAILERRMIDAEKRIAVYLHSDND